jgi:DNA recombination protein RmuC
LNVTIILSVAIVSLAGCVIAALWVRARARTAAEQQAATSPGQLTALQVELEGVRSTARALEGQLAAARQDRELIEGAMRDERARATTALEALRSQLATENIRLRDAKESAERNAAVLAGNVQQNARALEEERALAARNGAELKNTVSALAQAREQGATQLQQLSELRKREAELVALRQSFDAMQLQLRSGSERAATLETSLEQERKASLERMSLREQEHLRLTQALSAASESERSLRTELAQVREQTAAQQQQIGDLQKRESELGELRPRLDVLQARLSSSMERAAALETELTQERSASGERIATRDQEHQRTLSALTASLESDKVARSELARVREQSAAQQQQIGELQKRETELREVRQQLDAVLVAIAEKSERVATLETQLEQQRKGAEERVAMNRELHEQLEGKFNGLAAQVLEKNTEKFEVNTKLRLNEMADALGKHVKELQAKVELTHSQDVQDRVALRTELQKMVEASHRIDQDAANLTRALTTDRKAQGAWGELILERILEQCGLREGTEYERQAVLTNDDNDRMRPDVIVRLPGKRHVVIDAKVSLTAYNEYVNAEDETTAALALQRHVSSVRTHMKGLAEKEYWRLNGLDTGDYVLMFLPLESAFAESLRTAPGLFEEAFRQQIILTSPSTLLATLRTIEHTWRVERQNATARTIVDQAGKLYDSTHSPDRVFLARPVMGDVSRPTYRRRRNGETAEGGV